MTSTQTGPKIQPGRAFRPFKLGSRKNDDGSQKCIEQNSKPQVLLKKSKKISILPRGYRSDPEEQAEPSKKSEDLYSGRIEYRISRCKRTCFSIKPGDRF